VPSTPIYGLPYPSLTDPPNGPAQFQALAEAVETELNRIDGVLTSTPVTQSSSVAATVSTSSTTYVALSGDPGLAFTAPTSGRVIISIGGALTGSAADTFAMMGFQVRTGAVVGSGTIVYAVNNNDVVSNEGGDDMSASKVTLVSGLTAGGSYNVQVLYKMLSGSGTAFFARRDVIVLSVA
jgi:hypothetical protein